MTYDEYMEEQTRTYYPNYFIKQLNNQNVNSNANNMQANNNGMQTERRHVHEFLGGTKLAGQNEERHNHRFAGVTGEAIPISGGNHIHALTTNADFFDEHRHRICVKTGPAIRVGDGKHIHFVKGTTTFDDGHVHRFIFATLIESPLTPVR